MCNTISQNETISGKVTFLQHYLPYLKAGKYCIESQQIISDNKDNIFETFSEIRVFNVSGERFSLNPADIYSVYPPENTEGEYFNCLPHIVLTRKTLPWERTLLSKVTDLKDFEDVAPWLALILIDENENIPEVKNISVSDLLTISNGGTLPNNYISYPYEKDSLCINDEEKCQAIDIPIDIFNKICPSLDDLKWLGHGRQVNTTKKQGDLDMPKTETQEFSVIISNRFPEQGCMNAVFLVSLEQLGDYLPGKHQKIIDGKDMIRLISLKKWNFKAKKDKKSFTKVLTDLKPGTLQIPLFNANDSTSDEEKELKDIFDMGFTALNHQLRNGDKTVSFYRGPLIPCSSKKSVKLPARCADSLTQYNPDTGMFDVSYSSAWQLGRMMALSNKNFCMELYNWKRNNRQDIISIFENNFIETNLLDTKVLEENKDSHENLKIKLANNIGNKLSDFVDLVKDPTKKSEKIPSSRIESYNNNTYSQELSQTLNNSEKIDSILGSKISIPFHVTAYLARLKLLKDVPIKYLIPDERMLPEESIRFFYLDFNWIYSLVDGAYSIGRNTTGDWALDDALSEKVHEQVLQEAQKLRKDLSVARGKLEIVTGFIIRSSVIQDWPGLEVSAYGKGSDAELPILRFENILPNILIGIFDGEIDKLTINEPPEGLHFGLDKDDNETGHTYLDFFNRLRYIYPNTDNKNNGTNIPDIPISETKAIYRDEASDNQDTKYMSGKRVLNINEYANKLRTVLMNLKILKIDDHFTASEFALEMTEGVELVTFKNKG